MYTDKELQNFFCNVKRLRMENKLTKKQMAKICDVGVGTISKLEKGILPSRMSVEVLFRIYVYFGIILTDLFEEKMHK